MVSEFLARPALGPQKGRIHSVAVLLETAHRADRRLHRRFAQVLFRKPHSKLAQGCFRNHTVSTSCNLRSPTAFASAKRQRDVCTVRSEVDGPGPQDESSTVLLKRKAPPTAVSPRRVSQREWPAKLGTVVVALGSINDRLDNRGPSPAKQSKAESFTMLWPTSSGLVPGLHKEHLVYTGARRRS